MREGGEGQEGGNEALRNWYRWIEAAWRGRLRMHYILPERDDLIQINCWRLFSCRTVIGDVERVLRKVTNFQEE